MVVEGRTKTPAMLTLLLQKLATCFGEPTRSRSVLISVEFEKVTGHPSIYIINAS